MVLDPMEYQEGVKVELAWREAEDGIPVPMLVGQAVR